MSSKETLHIEETNTRLDFEPRGDVVFEVYKNIASDYSGNLIFLGRLPEQDQLEVVKFSVFNKGSQREWDGYLLASSRDIPTAIPVALVSRAQNPSQGLITEYIEGPSLEEAYTEDRLHRFGSELRRLHAIILSGYGYFDKTVPQFSSPQEYLTFWFDKTLPYVQGKSRAATLFKLLHDAASVDIYSFKPSFIHKDARLENVFVDGDGIKFIDFEWWQGGHPLDDIAISLYHLVRTDRDPNVFEPVIGGYFGNTHMVDQERATITFFLLFQALRSVSFSERINPSRKVEVYNNLEKILDYISAERLFKL